MTNFNEKNLLNVGGGFYRYTEPTNATTIGRKSLATAVTGVTGVEMTVLTRNIVAIENKGHRVFVLQSTEAFMKENKRKLERKFGK